MDSRVKELRTDLSSQLGNDALIYAAAGNHPHTCNELLAYRPDVTHSNEDGETAFTMAVRNSSSLGKWKYS